MCSLVCGCVRVCFWSRLALKTNLKNHTKVPHSASVALFLKCVRGCVRDRVCAQVCARVCAPVHVHTPSRTHQTPHVIPPNSPASNAAAAEAPIQHPCSANIFFDFSCLLLLCDFPLPLFLLSDFPLTGFHKTPQNIFILHLEQKSCNIIMVMIIIIRYQTSALKNDFKSCLYMRFDPIYVSVCVSWYVVVF